MPAGLCDESDLLGVTALARGVIGQRANELVRHVTLPTRGAAVEVLV
jgi:hypothetical protein